MHDGPQVVGGRVARLGGRTTQPDCRSHAYLVNLDPKTPKFPEPKPNPPPKVSETISARGWQPGPLEPPKCLEPANET